MHMWTKLLLDGIPIAASLSNFFLFMGVHTKILDWKYTCRGILGHGCVYATLTSCLFHYLHLSSPDKFWFSLNFPYQSYAFPVFHLSKPLLSKILKLLSFPFHVICKVMAFTFSNSSCRKLIQVQLTLNRDIVVITCQDF